MNHTIDPTASSFSQHAYQEWFSQDVASQVVGRTGKAIAQGSYKQAEVRVQPGHESPAEGDFGTKGKYGGRQKGGQE